MPLLKGLYLGGGFGFFPGFQFLSDSMPCSFFLWFTLLVSLCLHVVGVFSGVYVFSSSVIQVAGINGGTLSNFYEYFNSGHEIIYDGIYPEAHKPTSPINPTPTVGVAP